MGRLEGKIAIITGTESGIGEATVELFRSGSSTVVGSDIAESVVGAFGRIDLVFANAVISGGWATIAGGGRRPVEQPSRGPQAASAHGVRR